MRRFPQDAAGEISRNIFRIDQYGHSVMNGHFPFPCFRKQ
jgi:hypothetical protein